VPVEILWSRRAQTRLAEIRSFTARDKPEAAERLALRIVSLVEALRDHPYIGRSSIEPGVRELVIGGTPYVVQYRVLGQHITIVTIWHGAQKQTP
jgi:toxin ParE1/3/4